MNEFQTQRQKIFFYLLAGKCLTGIEALQLFACMRLGARIYELKKLGIPIKDRFITVVARNGKTKRVKEYWIDAAHFFSIKQAYAEGRLNI